MCVCVDNLEVSAAHSYFLASPRHDQSFLQGTMKYKKEEIHDLIHCNRSLLAAFLALLTRAEGHGEVTGTS